MVNPVSAANCSRTYKTKHDIMSSDLKTKLKEVSDLKKKKKQDSGI